MKDFFDAWAIGISGQTIHRMLSAMRRTPIRQQQIAKQASTLAYVRLPKERGAVLVRYDPPSRRDHDVREVHAGPSACVDVNSKTCQARTSAEPGWTHDLTFNSEIHMTSSNNSSADHAGYERLLAILDAIDQSASATIKQARKRGLSKGAEEIIQQDADEAKRRVRDMTLDYEHAKPANLETLCRPEHDKQLVRVRCSIGELSRPVQVEKLRDAGATAVDLLGAKASDYDQNMIITLESELTLVSEHGSTFATEKFLDRQLIEFLQVSMTQFATHEVLLFVAAGPAIEGSSQQDSAEDSSAAGHTLVRAYQGFVVDARPLRTALQMAAPTPGEQEEARRRYGQQADLVSLGASLATRRLEIQEEDHLSILSEAIRFEVLNASTDGKRGHSLLLGPPGVGKSTVAKVGQMFQPVFRWALPTKITEAGLIGSGSTSARCRKPGLIPLAHTGMLSIEDANQMNSVKNQRCMSSFTTVMQDGKVADASVSRTEYHAEVAIHLDANRKSDVRRTGGSKSGLDLLIDDTGIPLNVLSRMTYLAEIPRDTATQMRVAFGMIESKQRLSDLQGKCLDQEIRLFQVWSAMMRHAHPAVDFPATVRAAIHDRVAAAYNTTVARMENHPELGDFLTRLAEQAHTLVSAHARLHDRGVATVGDVDAVFPYLWRKLDFVRTVLFGSQIATSDASAAAKGRRLLIENMVKRRRSVVFTVEDIRRWTGMTSATKATMADDLRVLYGDPNAEGQYRVTGVVDPAA